VRGPVIGNHGQREVNAFAIHMMARTLARERSPW